MVSLPAIVHSIFTYFKNVYHKRTPKDTKYFGYLNGNMFNIWIHTITNACRRFNSVCVSVFVSTASSSKSYRHIGRLRNIVCIILYVFLEYNNNNSNNIPEKLRKCYRANFCSSVRIVNNIIILLKNVSLEAPWAYSFYP